VKLLFVTDRLHIPHDFSGSVQSTHTLILALLKRGYSCKVIASLPRKWRHFLSTILYKVSGEKLLLEWSDSLAGYPAQRASMWRIGERITRVLANEKLDILVLDSFRMLSLLAKKVPDFNKPIALIVHDTFFTQGPRELPFQNQLTIVTNSPFTASELNRHFGVSSTTISPLINLQDYLTGRDSAKYVTLVTPHPRKGLNIVLELAAKLPSIPFLLVEGWPMEPEEWQALKIQTQARPNISLLRSTSNMKEIYEKTKILLVPSELETFGRVAVEAQCSGIPVLAKDVGALRWVIGDGGKALAPTTSIDEWVAHLNRWYSDSETYRELSEQAKCNVQREEFQPSYIADSFDRTFKKMSANPQVESQSFPLKQSERQQ
jgi:glycosyltransferase involved in cell wall biosynthesis